MDQATHVLPAWLIPIITAIVVLFIGRLFLQSDRRLEAMEKRLEERINATDKAREGMQSSLTNALKSAEHSVQESTRTSKDMVDHVRRTVQALNNVVTELRIRVERIDTQQQMKLFDRANRWHASPPPEEEGPR